MIAEDVGINGIRNINNLLHHPDQFYYYLETFLKVLDDPKLIFFMHSSCYHVIKK